MKVDPSTATAVNLQLMAVTRNIARARNNVLIAAEALPEGQDRDELMSVYEAMGQPLYNTDLNSGEEAAVIPQEEINTLVEGLPTPDKMVNLPPEQAERNLAWLRAATTQTASASAGGRSWESLRQP